MFFVKNPNLKIIATLIVRDEEDIIRANIEHHINQGVSGFIVIDNVSKDNTKAILSKYKEVLDIIDEPETNYDQSKWVTKLARMACKHKPDWIVHLDADEFWCGLMQVRNIDAIALGCPKMYFHPPKKDAFSVYQLGQYLNFENVNLPGECKIMHRPNENIIIEYRNYCCNLPMQFTGQIWRHHFPIRTYSQFVRKAVNGHQSLMKRDAICNRWKKWYDLYLNGELEILFNQVCDSWQDMMRYPNKDSLLSMLELWDDQKIIQFFQESEVLPTIGEWPK